MGGSSKDDKEKKELERQEALERQEEDKIKRRQDKLRKVETANLQRSLRVGGLTSGDNDKETLG